MPLLPAAGVLACVKLWALSEFTEYMNKQEIARKLIEHDVKLNQTVTAVEFSLFRDAVLVNLDEILTIVRRLDTENAAATGWLKRLDAGAGVQATEIADIKRLLAADS